MPPRKALAQVPNETLHTISARFNADLEWMYESCDKETQIMTYDMMDAILRRVMIQTINGNAPGGVRIIFDRIKAALMK